MPHPEMTWGLPAKPSHRRLLEKSTRKPGVFTHPTLAESLNNLFSAIE